MRVVVVLVCIAVLIATYLYARYKLYAALKALPFVDQKAPRPSIRARAEVIQDAMMKASEVPGLGVFVVERRTGKVVYSDGYVEAVLGLNDGSFLKQTWRTVVHPLDLSRLSKLFSDSEAVEAVLNFTHKKGFTVKLKFYWTNGSEGLDTVYVTDVTYQEATKRLQVSTSTLKELVS